MHIHKHIHVHIHTHAHPNTSPYKYGALKTFVHGPQNKGQLFEITRARQRKQTFACTHMRIQKLIHSLKSRTCRLDFPAITEPPKYSHKADKINDSYAKSHAHQHKQTYTCTHARIQKLKHCMESRTCRLDFHVNTEPSKHSHKAPQIKDNYAKSRACQHKQTFTRTHTRIQKFKHCLKSRTCRFDIHVNMDPSKQSHKEAKITDSYPKSRARQHKQTYICTHTHIQKLKHSLKSRNCRLDFHVNTVPSKHSRRAVNINKNYANTHSKSNAYAKHARIFIYTYIYKNTYIYTYKHRYTSKYMPVQIRSLSNPRARQSKPRTGF